MRSKDNTTASIGTQGDPSLCFFDTKINDASPSSSRKFSATSPTSSYTPLPPLLGKTRLITYYFSVDSLYQNNKRRAKSQSTSNNRVVRPRASPQPPPLGDRLILSRTVRSCQTIHQSTHYQSTIEIKPKRIQIRAILTYQTSYQAQQGNQQYIQSFFP